MALIVDLRIVPSSGRQKCFLDKAGNLKCYLKRAPQKGKANSELISFLSKKLKMTKDSIDIILGVTSNKKRILIKQDIKIEDFLKYLDIVGKKA